MFREKIFTQCSDIDYVFIMEGEESIVEVCQNPQDIERIKGVMYKDRNGLVNYSGDRDPIEYLDYMGFPKYECFDINRYDFIPIITSRGCPANCIYCCSSDVHGIFGF